MEAAGEGKECIDMFWLFMIGALVLEVCLRRLVPQMGTRWKVVGVTVLFAVVLFYRGNLLLPASEVKEVIQNPGNENAARLDPFMGKLLVVALNLSLRDHYEPGEPLPEDGLLYINHRCAFLIRDNRGREYRVEGFIGGIGHLHKGPLALEYWSQYYFISDREVREVDWLFDDVFLSPFIAFIDFLDDTVFELQTPLRTASS